MGTYSKRLFAENGVIALHLVQRESNVCVFEPNLVPIRMSTDV